MRIHCDHDCKSQSSEFRVIAQMHLKHNIHQELVLIWIFTRSLSTTRNKMYVVEVKGSAHDFAKDCLRVFVQNIGYRALFLTSTATVKTFVIMTMTVKCQVYSALKSQYL